MDIFLTGGSGFVGGHLIERLVEQGHEVRAMARSQGSADRVAELGAHPVHISLERVAAEHLRGADVVIHTAAYVEEWGPEERFRAINVEGTRRLLRAARAVGAERFVHISTNAAVFEDRDQHAVDESHPYPRSVPFAYGATKAEAERLVLAADDEAMTTLALRPCFVWGPRDNSLLPAVRQMAQEGRFLWLDGGRAQVSTTHVGNLVAAVEQALHHGRGGEAYFVADDDDLTLRAFLGGLAGTIDLELPDRSLPGGVVRPVAQALEAVWTWLGLESAPPVPRMTASLMSSAMTVRTDKARRELDWEPLVSREQGLAELAAGGAERAA